MRKKYERERRGRWREMRMGVARLRAEERENGMGFKYKDGR